MISSKFKSNFRKTRAFLKDDRSDRIRLLLGKYGEIGVERLSQTTPISTGLTAQSWSFSVKRFGDNWALTFSNSNMENGLSVAILLLYGHATKNGYFIPGIDYLEPAIRPTVDELRGNILKELNYG